MLRVDNHFTMIFLVLLSWRIIYIPEAQIQPASAKLGNKFEELGDGG